MTDIDPLAVLSALGITPQDTPQPVRGGMDKAMWRFRAPDGGPRALRLYEAGPRQQAMAEREQAAIRAVRAAGLPAPEVTHAGMWQDRPALVIRWLPGRTLADAVAGRPWQLWRLGVRMGRVQARLHAIAPPPGLAVPSSNIWIDWPAATRPDLVERLRAERPRTDALIHLDYHPLNILAAGGRISGLVDWTNAAAGDPRADIARTRVLLEAAPLPATPLRPILQRARRLLAYAWWRGYSGRAGRLDHAGLAPFYAWAGATLLHDLAPRVGRFGDWLRPHDLDTIRAWTARWEA